MISKKHSRRLSFVLAATAFTAGAARNLSAQNVSTPPSSPAIKSGCVIGADLNQTMTTGQHFQIYDNPDDPLSIGCNFGKHITVRAAMHDINKAPDFDSYLTNYGNTLATYASNVESAYVAYETALETYYEEIAEGADPSTLGPPPSPPTIPNVPQPAAKPHVAQSLFGQKTYFPDGVTVTAHSRSGDHGEAALTAGLLNVYESAATDQSIATRFRPYQDAASDRVLVGLPTGSSSLLAGQESYALTTYGLIGGTAAISRELGRFAVKAEATAGNEMGRGAHGLSYGANATAGYRGLTGGVMIFQNAPDASDARETRYGGFAEYAGTILHRAKFQVAGEGYEIKNRIAFNPGHQISWTTAGILEKDNIRGGPISVYAAVAAKGNTSGSGVSTGYAQSYGANSLSGEFGFSARIAPDTFVRAAYGVNSPFGTHIASQPIPLTLDMTAPDPFAPLENFNPMSLIQSGKTPYQQAFRLELQKTISLPKLRR